MNADATPMHPLSYTAYDAIPPRDPLKDYFREYGNVCFRNGFIVGFVTGVCVMAFAALKGFRA